MPIEVGARIGPYQILSAIGSGGMGKVYRARDTTLNRDVALKVLIDPHAADPERLARFRREAQVLASLNHPHIAAIYGIEEYDEGQALVLELVEGPTLAERSARGVIPLDEALEIADQMVDALDAAHEKGIVHRDLKPANICIGPAGRVKVLDFGLARLAEPSHASSGGGADITDAPTVIASLPGTILGTAAYMAPEQTKGDVADRVSDVWSFGCVLYEMLAGRPAFGGSSLSEIISEVLKSEPDWTRLPAQTPQSIRRLLHRCLAKDRRRRLHDIADARLEIEDARDQDRVSPTTAPRGSRRAERLVWLSALIIASAVAFWSERRMSSVAPAPPMRVEITTPPTSDPASIAISPDGRTVAFAANDEGKSRLWVRSLEEASARALAGTDAAYDPFWSPDGRSLGFFANGMLKRIDVDAGSVQTLADASAGRGGAWATDGTILFAPQAGPIYRIAATGGERTQVTPIDQRQTNARFPQILPDGRHFLYYMVGSPQIHGIYVGDMDGSAGRRVVAADAAGAYTASGHLAFVRQRTLFIQRFDTERLELTGDPVSVANELAVDVNVGISALSASAAGPIVYRTGLARGERQLTWFDRTGNEIQKVGQPDETSTWGPALSPDGRTVAMTRTVNGNQDVWLLDAARQVLRRFTSHEAADLNPVWSPDGSRIAFTSNREVIGALYSAAVTGNDGEHALLLSGAGMQATDWSRDGRYLLFRRQTQSTRYDVWALRLEGEPKPFAVVQTNFDERDAQFSPDGKWIAFESDESGRFEVYVQPFPGPGRKWPISTNGGAQARWRGDGRELFYVGGDERLMAVSIALDADRQTVDAGEPVALFPTHVGAMATVNKQQFMPSADGRRFLINTITYDRTSPITVLLNWKGP